MAAPVPTARIASVDQFRGYTVVGMVLVNYLAKFALVDPLFKHNLDYCSYADTIMPQFFFCVGFSLRLSMLRRLETGSPWAAYGHALKRCFGLFLLGVVFYHLEFRFESWKGIQKLLEQRGWFGLVLSQFERNVFQTLVHIAVTSAWLLPVIGLRTRWLVLWLLLSAGLHLLLSGYFYFDWATTKKVIDGGPLGFLSWSIPTLWGALAHDAMRQLNRPRLFIWLLAWGVVLMALGYGLSCLNGMVQAERLERSPWAAAPFVPPTEIRELLGKKEAIEFWTMSQRTGSVSYQTFAAGLSLVLLLLFVVCCDWGPVRVPLFRTLGQNPLAAYLIHSMAIDATWPLFPSDSPLWFVLVGFGLVLGITWLFTRYLEKQGIFLRL